MEKTLLFIYLFASLLLFVEFTEKIKAAWHASQATSNSYTVLVNHYNNLARFTVAASIQVTSIP